MDGTLIQSLDRLKFGFNCWQNFAIPIFKPSQYSLFCVGLPLEFCLIRLPLSTIFEVEYE